MIVVSLFARVARRIGVDPGRALANAHPDPARVARDRHEQYQAVHRRAIPATVAPRPAPRAEQGENAD